MTVRNIHVLSAASVCNILVKMLPYEVKRIKI